MSMRPTYDRLGCAYSTARAPDPRIAGAIERALGDAESVLNVGAGTGAYEPRERSVVAVEPSSLMIAQRSLGAAPATYVGRFWLSEYLPSLAPIDEARLPPIAAQAAELGCKRIIPVPIPADCSDGFLAAHWQRPHAYVDPRVRANISSFDLLRRDEVDAALAQHATRGRELDGHHCLNWKQQHALKDCPGG